MQPWVEQFHRIELHQKWKDGNGDRLGKRLTSKTEKNLMKCFLIHDCIMLREVWLVDPS
jgi:hypothetical protein